MGRPKRGVACVIALALGTACAGSGNPTAPAPEAAAKPDLFPEMTAGLERQLEERRRAALARGAEMKALGIDPFEGELTQSRLTELGIPSLGGCTTEKGRLHREPALRAHRQLRAEDFRSREPRSPDPTQTYEVLSRRAVIPSVFVSCTMETETQRSARGGFEVRARSARFTAFFDAEMSWLNPRQRADAPTLLHAQLHFDLANLMALEANRNPWFSEIVGEGTTRDAAEGDFTLRWAGRLGRLQSELRRFETQLDRETAQGWDTGAQAQWVLRVREGLPAVRAALPRG
ncbi:MAG: hypothetical protein JRH01_04015 [Deltaproteobacteria bacterium]|nr:hypothetical protein [Deltaproteobacteria bacterium]MBW2396151.1 hypothetical protein [Deltaproteobacteria bacterium]